MGNFSIRTATGSTLATAMPRASTSTTGTTTTAMTTSVCPRLGSQHLFCKEAARHMPGSSYVSRDDFIHPPSIRPISSIFSSRIIYFLTSMTLASFARRKNTLRRLSFTLTFFRIGSFSALYASLAARIPSMTSRMAFSLRIQIVCFLEDWDIEIIHNCNENLLRPF